jgi:hypothetical protein
MPQFWIAIFFTLLAVAQLYESIKEIELPLPVYLVLGTMLAIASNSHRKFSLNYGQQTASPEITTTGLNLDLPLQSKPLATEDLQDKH